MNHSPAVLQVLPALISGGVERGTVDVAQALVKAECRAFVASAGGQLVHDVERVGGVHITLPLGDKLPWQISANAKKLADLIQKNDIHIVHARSRAPAWVAWQACQILRRKNYPVNFVTTFHGQYKTGSGLWGKFKHKYNSIMVRGERVIAVSKFIEQHIKDSYGITDDVIRVIPRGVDIAKFDAARVSNERMIALMKAWHIPEYHPIILMPARLSRMKGHLFLLAALGRIVDQDWFCVMVGSAHGHDEFRAEIEGAIRRLGLEGRVRMLDHCDDMPAAYRLADVVVCPSLQPEAFGRIPIEAQAMGRLIVAADHGGAQETIVPQDHEQMTGWLYPPTDDGALATCLLDALKTTDAARRTIAMRAVAHIAEHFTKDDMCRQTLDVYNELLSQGVRHEA